MTLKAGKTAAIEHKLSCLLGKSKKWDLEADIAIHIDRVSVKTTNWVCYSTQELIVEANTCVFPRWAVRKDGAMNDAKHCLPPATASDMQRVGLNEMDAFACKSAA